MASTKNSPEKPQLARFLEAARKAGVDESGAEFERVMGMILPPAKRPKKKKN
jgi:hypothetical protein